MPWYLVVVALILALLMAGVIWSWVWLLLLPVRQAVAREDRRRMREHDQLLSMLKEGPGRQEKAKPRRRRSGV